MTEAVEKGNFSLKLETFFNSCILEGWKDSIVSTADYRKVCPSGQKISGSSEGASILLLKKYLHPHQRSHGPTLVPDQGMQKSITTPSQRIGGQRT